jgi:ribosomal protein L32
LDEDRRREDDWFRQNEKELLDTARQAREKREAERRAKEKTAELDRLKLLHFMRCPKCGHQMIEEPLEGITIDRCSFCEGIYFDANELDQLFTKKQDERRNFLRRLLKI